MKTSDSVNILDYGFSILQIETSSVCNMQCKFCPYPLINDKGKILSEDAVFQIIDTLRFDNRFEYICFSQFNEPLLDERIYDFIRYAKSKHFPVMLVTNGSLFNSRDVINRLIGAAPDLIKLSVQTLNNKIFHNSSIS